MTQGGGSGVSNHQTPWRTRFLRHYSVSSRDLTVGVVSGTLVAVLTLFAQALIDNSRDTEAERRENLRFVREQSAGGEAGEVSFRSIDLGERNLSGLGLREAMLTDSNLINANLVRVDLSGAQLIRAELSGADLQSATLIGTHFGDARMVNVNLRNADLTDAHISGAHLLGGDLRNATLVNAQLYNADLSGVDLRGADLTGAVFDDANLYGANLTGAIIDYKTDPVDGRSYFIPHVCYDSFTKWPERLAPPPMNHIFCAKNR